jgi:hypothetical protein
MKVKTIKKVFVSSTGAYTFFLGCDIPYFRFFIKGHPWGMRLGVPGYDICIYRPHTKKSKQKERRYGRR